MNNSGNWSIHEIRPLQMQDMEGAAVVIHRKTRYNVVGAAG